MDGLKENLLSVSQMCDKGCEVIFRAQDCEVISSTTGKTVIKGVQIESNVYILKEENEAFHLSKLEESWLWHRILGHLNFDHIISLSKKKAVRDMPEINKPSNTICKSFQLGKQTCTSFKTKDEISTSRPLQLVHMDLCGPSRTKTPSGESYFMLIIDDFSIMTWVAFLKYKSEALEKFKIFKALAENQIGCKIKCIKLDRGGEFIDYDFADLCNEHGIKQQFTIAGTPQYNGVVERQDRSVQESNIPQTFWVELVHTAVHILNKSHLRPNSDKTPYELWHGKPAVGRFNCFHNSSST